jgi:hypothetical protein
VFKLLKKFIKACLPYGLILAWQKGKGEEKCKRILGILNKDYSLIISDYKKRKDVTVKSCQLYPVWVCWWQGKEAMTEVVKICYSQLLKNANGHTINLITKDNYKEFVSLPEYILEKFNKGFISITHLSDILRVALLAKYGGLWIDSTVYTLYGLPEFNTRFFSVRRLRDSGLLVEDRWAVFLLYTEKSCILFDYLKDILFEYMKINNRFIDYFLLDYFIALGYEHIPEIQRLIDNVPFSNPYVHWLRNSMNLKYNEQSFLALTDLTQFCKLTYKHRYKEKTNEGLLTYYGFIKKKAQI